MCIIEQETHHIPISQVCDIRNMYLSEKVLTFELVLLDNVPCFMVENSQIHNVLTHIKNILVSISFSVSNT